jgi:hypothetical protein
MQEWIFYVGVGIVLMLIQMLLLWLEGGMRFALLVPIIVFNAVMIPYSLALIHVLDNQAVAALDSMKPTLAIPEPQFDDLRYRLSTMRSRPPFVVGLALAVFLVLTEWTGTVPARYAALADLPLFAIVYHVIDKTIAFVYGPFLYHSIAQLSLVHAVYSKHTRIILFDLKPLYAFSRLTAFTAAGLTMPVYGWVLINPELSTDPLSLVAMVAFTILGASTFLWPLVGAHGLMEKEKESLLREIDLRFEAVFAVFNQRIHDGDYPAADQLNGTIASLEIQHGKIKAIPTWPWRPETARLAMTALALPPVFRALQCLIEQALGW